MIGMQTLHLSGFAFVLMASLPALHAGQSDFREVVRIDSGILKGVVNSEKDVIAFKGIPYAAPPVGRLRWREPLPPARWEGVRTADTFGASCTQPPNACLPPYTAEFSVTNAMSEDCLFLNVWTPAKSASDQLAVMVYIHGGAGIRGSGSVPIYDGEALAKKGILVVTINFRLGIFGGMGHPQLTKESPHRVCGNYGMLDIVAALKWVHENIAAFGGDPAKVTLCGQSSGCMVVHYLMTSPLAKGLFRGVIAMSFPYDYLMKPHAIGNVWQKEQEGLKFASAHKASSIEELRNIPASIVLADNPMVAPFTRACLSGSPNIDGWSFLMEYPKALDAGQVADVPVLTGITADDFGPPAKYLKTTVACLVAELPNVFGEKKKAFIEKEADYLALCPAASSDQAVRETVKQAQREYRMACVFHWATLRAKSARTPVYTYIFEQPIPWPQHPEFGVFHSSDLPYVFNNLIKLDRPWADDDRHVADQVSSYWVNFVKTGNPNGRMLPEWTPFDPSNSKIMAIGARPESREIGPKERLRFCQELLQK